MPVNNPFLADQLPDPLPDDPFPWLEGWLAHATENQTRRNPNAMTLGTVAPGGGPSGRVVLAKMINTEMGYVVFFTNYRSSKSRDIEANPAVSLVFHWDSFGRQARIEGTAVRSPASESDAYFASRDRGSQIGAWGSDQSQPLESRDALIQQLQDRANELGVADDDSKAVPRPPHWGGFRVWASAVELWVDGTNRVHDRARFERSLEPDGDGGFKPTPWTRSRLQP